MPVRRSIQEDHLICLVCGKRQKALRRHLSIVHQLTPEAYRELLGLKPDYPMVASGYSRQRSEMARRSGLVVAVTQRHEARQPRRAGCTASSGTHLPRRPIVLGMQRLSCS